MKEKEKNFEEQLLETVERLTGSPLVFDEEFEGDTFFIYPMIVSETNDEEKSIESFCRKCKTTELVGIMKGVLEVEVPRFCEQCGGCLEFIVNCITEEETDEEEEKYYFEELEEIEKKYKEGSKEERQDILESLLNIYGNLSRLLGVELDE
jgi:Fe-S-cluster containining protein